MDFLTRNVATDALPTTVLNFVKCIHLTVGLDSSVGIAIGYGLDGPGIESR